MAKKRRNETNEYPINTPRWRKGEKFGREFVHGLRGGHSDCGAVMALHEAAKLFYEPTMEVLAGFCEGAAKAVWSRQRKAQRDNLREAV